MLDEKQFQHVVDKLIEGRGSVEAMNAIRDIAALLYSRLMAEGFSLVSFLIGEDYENQQKRFFGDFPPSRRGLKVPPKDIEDTPWMDSPVHYFPRGGSAVGKKPAGKKGGRKEPRKPKKQLDNAGGK